MRTLHTIVVGAVAAVALVAAFLLAPGGAAPRAVGGPHPVTLTFAGEVVGEDGLADFVDPYPPIENGVALDYRVPDGSRLVIDALYADVAERWAPGVTTPRTDVMVGVSTQYDLGPACFYPGWQRSYDVPLVTDVAQVYGPEEAQARHAGNLSGPIFVEGGRHVSGTAWAPGGDSTVHVHVVAHGHLEPATNPVPPVCGED